MMIIWVIWGAMFVSIGIYIIIGVILAGSGMKIAFDIPLETVKIALLVFSLAQVTFAIMLKKMILMRVTPVNTTPSGRNDLITTAAGKYNAAIIMSLAISEVIAVLGLIYFLISHDYWAFYMYCAISAGSMIMIRPTVAELEGVAEALKKSEAMRT